MQHAQTQASEVGTKLRFAAVALVMHEFGAVLNNLQGARIVYGLSTATT
jgi:hypothetical protein